MQRINVSGWLRQALRRPRRSEAAVESGRKLEAIRSAFEHEFPTADIDQVLEEVERGYMGETDPSSR